MTLYPNTSALFIAALIQAELALSKVKLFTDCVPPLSVSTIKADFVEADYQGYVAKTVTAWLAPYLDPAGGATIQSGTEQFDFGPGPGVGNVINGFWVENAAGDVITAGTFDAPISMNADGDSIPMNVALNFCAPAV